MSETPIIVKYGGIEITYEERTNVWNFELRGRERNTVSLNDAKEAIDKPDPVKKKPFTRIPAFVLASIHYGAAHTFEAVQITSVAERQSFNGNPQVWIVDSAGKRSQEPIVKVYQDTPLNRARMASYIAADKHMTNLRKENEAALKLIAVVEVPSE